MKIFYSKMVFWSVLPKGKILPQVLKIVEVITRPTLVDPRCTLKVRQDGLVKTMTVVDMRFLNATQWMGTYHLPMREGSIPNEVEVHLGHNEQEVRFSE